MTDQQSRLGLCKQWIILSSMLGRHLKPDLHYGKVLEWPPGLASNLFVLGNIPHDIKRPQACCTNVPVDEIVGHSIPINVVNISFRHEGTVSFKQEVLSRIYLGASDSQQNSGAYCLKVTSWPIT